MSDSKFAAHAELEQPESNWLCFGPPGCGKTTFLKSQVERASQTYGAEKVLVCSFTKAAAAEIGSRVNLPKRSVGTLHSVCFHALDRPALTEGKEKEFNDLYPDFALTVKNPSHDDHVDDLLAGDSEKMGDKLRGELDLYRVSLNSDIPDHLQEFREAWNDWKEEREYMDFTDLLEKCLEGFDAAPGMPDAIFFDEAQDASKLQTSLLAQWGRYTKRLILAGDDDQAIFFWAGADYKSFLDFPCGKNNRRYLEQSYRVPAAVHRAAESWIKTLCHRETKIYKPREAEGFVDRCWGTYYAPESAVDMAESLIGQGKTVMFEATCSYMLEPLKAVLRKRGLPFHNPWRKTRGDWNPLVSGGEERCMPVDRLKYFLRPLVEMWGEHASFWRERDLWAWGSCFESKGNLAYGAKAKLDDWKKGESLVDPSAMPFIFQPHILDKLDEFLGNTGMLTDQAEAMKAVRWLLESLPDKESKKLIYPAAVFERGGCQAITDKPKIILGTGHSLKGSEADICFIFPDLSRKAWDGWNYDSDTREGIIRLFYVMLTRAREGAYLCRPASTMNVAIPA